MNRFSPNATAMPSLPTLLGSPLAHYGKCPPSAMQFNHPQNKCLPAQSVATRQHRQRPRSCSVQSSCSSASTRRPSVRFAAGSSRTPTGSVRWSQQPSFSPRSAEMSAPASQQGQTPRIGFNIEELYVGAAGCDPTQEPLRSQIVTKLGFPQDAKIERLAGNCGGLNEGMWVLQDVSTRSSLVLKLVQNVRANGRPLEADRFARIFQEHPSITNDPTVAFPTNIFKFYDRAGSNSHDLIVMRKVNGRPLGDVLALKRSSGQMLDAMQILRQLGKFLARFHKSYGNKQHGDFQPSNIFYDASNGAFALVDLADMGHGSHTEGDVAHFCQSLNILSNSYGPQFYSNGKRNFEEGYRGLRERFVPHDSRIPHSKLTSFGD